MMNVLAAGLVAATVEAVMPGTASRALDKLPSQRRHRGGVRISRRRQARDRDAVEISRLEPRVHPLQVHHRPNEQHGAHQQHRGQRGLTDHDGGSHSARCRRTCAKHHGSLQRARRVFARSVDGAREPERDTGDRRDRDAHREDGAVDLGARQLLEAGRQRVQQQTQTDRRQREAGEATQRSDERTLGEQQAEQAPTAGAKRRANRQLPVAQHAAGHLKMRDVGAGDEEQQADRERQHDHRRLDMERLRWAHQASRPCRSPFH